MTAPPRRPWGGREHVTAVRTVVLAIWFAIVAVTPYGYYARFPDAMLAPYGIGRLLLGSHALRSVILAYPVLLALKYAALATCALALLYPNRWRRLTPVVFVLVLALECLTKAHNGFVNHAQLAPLFVLLVFALFGGKRFLPTLGFGRKGAPGSPSPDGAYAAVAWLAALMLVLPYTFIALNRLREGRLELFLGGALLDYITRTSKIDSVYHSSLFLRLIQVPWLAAALKGGYFVTTLTEATSAGVLVSLAYRRWWLMVIMGFHLMTLLAMNIFFWENMLLGLVLFGWAIRTGDGLPPRGAALRERSVGFALQVDLLQVDL